MAIETAWLNIVEIPGMVRGTVAKNGRLPLSAKESSLSFFA